MQAVQLQPNRFSMSFASFITNHPLVHYYDTLEYITLLDPYNPANLLDQYLCMDLHLTHCCLSARASEKGGPLTTEINSQ